MCVVQEIPYECVPLTILKVAHICTILNYHSHLLKRGGTVDISVLVGSIEGTCYPPPRVRFLLEIENVLMRICT